MSDEYQQWQNFKQGDEKALEAIFLRYHKELYLYGHKICPTRTQIDDSIQDLFLELWVSRERLGDVVSLRAYLFRALKYKLLRAIKKERKLADLAADADGFLEFSYETKLIADQEYLEEKKRLMKHIKELSPRQQEALYLRYYARLSYSEISEIMAIGQQAVTNLVFKSIKGLRQSMLLAMPLLLYLF